MALTALYNMVRRFYHNSFDYGILFRSDKQERFIHFIEHNQHRSARSFQITAYRFNAFAHKYDNLSFTLISACNDPFEYEVGQQ